MPDSSKFKVLLWATVAVYLLLTASGIIFVDRVEQDRYESELRGDAVEDLGVLRAKLEERLSSDLSVSRSLAGIMPILPEFDQESFSALAKGLLREENHVRSIGLAEGMVLTYIYPMAGNEAAIGLDYTTNQAQWPAVKWAIDSRDIVVSGPVDLVQGGTAIIARTAFYYIVDRDDGQEQGDEFQGLVSVVIDTDTLLEDAGVLDTPGYNVAIRGKDGLGAEGELIYGDAEIFDGDPVTLEVALPAGSWQIASIPTQGWDSPSPQRYIYRLVALVATAIILIFVITQAQLLNARHAAVQKLRILGGLLPICAHCKKVRDDSGYWNQIESYVSAHSEADFSHGVCPDCMDEHYGDLDLDSIRDETYKS